MFVHGVPTQPELNVFALFLLAAFLGTALRAGKRILDDPVMSVSWETILVDGSMGVTVSFGLCLLFMAGLLLLNETQGLDFLLGDGPQATEKTKNKLRRAGVVMSIISFSGAFLLETSLSRLDERLKEKILSEK